MQRRSDWDYDPISPPTQSDIISETRLKDLEDAEYRKREEGSSDPGSGEDQRDPMAWTDGESNPYKYQSPDEIAAALAQKKRKRKRLLQEEMEYNEGLRVFHERRNAWTGAVSRKPKQKSKAAPTEGSKSISQSNSLNFDFDFEGSSRGSRAASPASASRASSPDSAASTEQHQSAQFSREPSPSPTIDIDPLIPIAPALLPRTNPVRAAITPSMYPTIYSKVVIQSLTPSVPIPLPDITNAIIQGWKDEGNWPPKSTVLVSEFKSGTTSSATTAAAAAKDKERREGGMRKGVSGAFRKALGLRSSVGGAGIHHHHLLHHHHHNKDSISNPSGEGQTGGSTGTNGGMDSQTTPEIEDAEAMFEEQ
ncbi:putative mitochondrial aaa atpase [Phaeomoniella chlamydospora]|uniref:Putative mitochondrial aaa atpase n=1 Tax=Phaeomoniella chlamydospora TaxID=158046 RepID=A0A0G2ENE2_PHACM|nr:putative mitochondrial aaa atpase [Phaeomoniella chlamydospora]